MDVHGVQTITFSSAEEFLNFRPVREFDCLLLDIHLVGASGIELRRLLKAKGSTVPVVFMTAIDNDAVRREAVQVGCVACLRKPFRPHQLFEAIAKATA